MDPRPFAEILREYRRDYGGLASRVVNAARLNHFLAFAPDSGVLTAEAGVTLAEIQSHFIPRGYQLPVTPGTRFVQLGGALAADVHGKTSIRRVPLLIM